MSNHNDSGGCYQFKHHIFNLKNIPALRRLACTRLFVQTWTYRETNEQRIEQEHRTCLSVCISANL